MHEKNVGIPLMFRSHKGEVGWSHLCISSAKLAATTKGTVIASFVNEFEILLVFRGKFVFLS